MNAPIALDREGWLTEAAGFILDDLIMPHANGQPRPDYRVSIGFPSGRTSRKTLAVCLASHVSADGTNEIFVTPAIDDSPRILDALAHELIHAVDDCKSGHRGPFARIARAIGLVGPLTHTTAGETLTAQLAEYVNLLGPIPHARVDLAARPKAGTRMIKCQCSACGFTFRTSAKWIEQMTSRQCNVCGRFDIQTSV